MKAVRVADTGHGERKGRVRHPGQFGLFNNGITITVANFAPGDGSYDLVEPYVVNGCQTTRTIGEVCQQRLEAGGRGRATTWRRGRPASGGGGVTKIVRVGSQGDALLQEITRYTNSQNAIKEKDFLTLTSDFKSWARLMDANYDIFLEVQRGGWESRRALQWPRPDLKQFADAANAFDLLKVYGAGWAKPARPTAGTPPSSRTGRCSSGS